VGGQRHDPAALAPGKSRYPLYKRLGGERNNSVRLYKLTQVFNSSCGIKTDSRCEMDKLLIPAQMHPSHDVASVQKWQILITYTSCGYTVLRPSSHSIKRGH